MGNRYGLIIPIIAIIVILIITGAITFFYNLEHTNKNLIAIYKADKQINQQIYIMEKDLSTISNTTYDQFKFDVPSTFPQALINLSELAGPLKEIKQIKLIKTKLAKSTNQLNSELAKHESLAATAKHILTQLTMLQALSNEVVAIYQEQNQQTKNQTLTLFAILESLLGMGLIVLVGITICRRNNVHKQLVGRRLNNSKGENEEFYQQELQQAMTKICQAYLNNSGTDKFLQEVLDIILSLKWLGLISKGAIFLTDELNPKQLKMKVAKRMTDFQQQRCAAVNYGECLCGGVAEKGELVFKPRCDKKESLFDSTGEVHGHYCVPIKYFKEVLGVITLYLPENFKSVPGDLEFLNNISIFIAESLLKKKLSDHDKLISEAIEQSAESVMITNTQGNIIYVNPAFERATCYTQREVLGKNARLLKSQKHDPAFYQDLWQTITQGKVWEGEFTNLTKSGNYFIERAIISPIRDYTDQITHYVSVKRDVTQERKLENELRHAQKMEAVGRVSAGIAHDFNNILAIIIGYSGHLHTRLNNNHPYHEPLEQIINASKRGANLVRGLLSFSRKQHAELHPVYLNDVIQTSKKLLIQTITNEIELTYQLSAEEINVMADRNQIGQILFNLVNNARDAMPQGGRINIETASVELDESFFTMHHTNGNSGQYGLISISDTGNGMDKKLLNKIFEPFFTTKSIGNGAGLGLAIINVIIQQHNGYINVYSEPGIGTTVRLYLPITSKPVNHHNQIDNTVQSPKGSETILLAEDDHDLRKFMKITLEEHGYQVVAAENGEEAIHVYKENKDKISLVLSDVIMPKKNGEEVMNVIKQLSPKIKILFMTGYSADILHDSKQIKEDVDIISKPIHPNKLLHKIREVIDQ